VLADDHLREEQEAERRLKRDRESADDALAQVRDAADSELRRAFAMLQDADRMVPVRADRKPLNEIVPLAPASLFDTDLLVGTRIVTAQMEASLMRIR
jgi:hypothetical protein